jgi:hypothetical protein
VRAAWWVGEGTLVKKIMETDDRMSCTVYRICPTFLSLREFENSSHPRTRPETPDARSR